MAGRIPAKCFLGLERCGLEHLLFLHRTWVWFLTPKRWLTAICTSSFMESDTLSWPLQVRDVHVVYIYLYIQSNTHTPMVRACVSGSGGG